MSDTHPTVEDIHSKNVRPRDSRDDSFASESELLGVSFWFRLSLTIFITALFVGQIRHTCYPDLSKNSGRFSEQNARLHLQKVTFLGPRTAGSIANEFWAANYLRSTLTDIVQLASKHGLVEASFDEQLSNYSFFRSAYHVTSYNGLRNFVLRFGSKSSGKNRRKAFLVNCHYDSAVDAPGASDTFVNCAILLELGRLLAVSRVNMLNDVIFLFNGAEENVLPASHAFITQHPWAKDVAAFLNLEGAGAGGRILLFQSGPGNYSDSLLEAYTSAFRHPFADVFAEELFRSGFVPSDTDYRIFRDYGNIPGLDMAYVNDGYCYHTLYDTEARISPECLQSTGDDLLRFLTIIMDDEQLQSIEKLKLKPTSKLSNANFLTSDNVSTSDRPVTAVELSPTNRYVYFDILGFTLFLTPWWVFKWSNWFLSCFWCVWMICRHGLNSSRWIGFLLAFFIQICGQLLTLAFAASLGYIIHTYGCRMSWYSSHYNLVGVFILPILTWFLWLNSYLFKVPDGLLNRLSLVSRMCQRSGWIMQKKVNYLYIAVDCFDAAQAVCLLQLILLNSLDTPTVYLISLWFSTTLFGRLLCAAFRVNWFSLSHLLIIILPVLALFHIYAFLNFIGFFIPIMGRGGHNVLPDLILSLGTFGLLSQSLLFLTGPLQCTGRTSAHIMRIILLNACLSYAVLVHSSPFGFPYSVAPNRSTYDDPHFNPRFQRIGLFHAVRRFRYQPNSNLITHEESQMLVIPLDVNSVRYLTPGSYPPPVHASIFSLFSPPEVNVKKDDNYGFDELVNHTGAPCNSSLPYCGIASLYPFLYLFNRFFQFPTEPHNANPPVNVTLLSRSILPNPVEANESSIRWNFTFKIDSGPPCTHVMLRTEKPFVHLIDWSFSIESNLPIPVPLPKSSESASNSTGDHYFVYHINSEAVHSQSSPWLSPWTFWLTFDVAKDSTPSHSYFDMAVSGIYMDVHLPSGRSEQMKYYLSRLPPWTVPMTACTSYEHYRFGFD